MTTKPDAPLVCSACKKQSETLMTLSLNNSNPTQPICLKCFKKLGRDMIKRMRTKEKGRG